MGVSSYCPESEPVSTDITGEGGWLKFNDSIDREHLLSWTKGELWRKACSVGRKKRRKYGYIGRDIGWPRRVLFSNQGAKKKSELLLDNREKGLTWCA